MRFLPVLLSVISVGLQGTGAEKIGNFRKEHVVDRALTTTVVGPTPRTWDLKQLDPDGSSSIKTCVKTPDASATTLPNIQVYFLSDTTRSMDWVMGSVMAAANTLHTSLAALATNVEFAVGEYKDQGNEFLYKLDQGFTMNKTDVQAAFKKWVPKGGSRKEANLYAMTKVAEEKWDPAKKHVLIWFGDKPGRDPSLGVTLTKAIDALKLQKIMVVALDAGRLDRRGQATAITSATGGMYVPSLDTSKVVDTIVAAMGTVIVAQTVIVKPEVRCDNGLALTFTPAEVSGKAGETLCMDESLKMAGCRHGATCDVTFKNQGTGAPIGEKQKISVTCCSKELISFRLWKASDPKGTEPKVINEGEEICLPSSEITIDAYYGDCLGYGKNPIRTVRLSHSVMGEKKSEKTERDPLYFLYGNVLDDIDFEPAMRGRNKISAEVNGESATKKERNFKFKRNC